MESKTKYSGKATSMASGLTAGSAVSLTLTVLGSLGIAKLLDLEKISWEKIGYGIMILLLISSFLGAAEASRKIKRRKLLVCTLSGIAYWVELAAITALLFGGQYEAVGVTGLLIMGGSLTAALLVSSKREGKNRKKRYSHR